VEVLPDGTFVTTTYGHWEQGEPPYILSVRLKLTELDALAEEKGLTGKTDTSAKKVLRVVAFGDSTTAPRSTVREVYAVRLEKLLKDRGIPAEVINSGVGGSHTGRLADNALHRKKHALDRFEEAVLAHKPDFVVMQFGWNDSWVDRGGEEGKSRIPVKDYTANLTHMIKVLREKGARVILMTPNQPRETLDKWRFERTARYVHAVREIAKDQKVPLVDIWRHYNKYAAAEGQKQSDLLLDDVHPNDAGHKLVAELLADVIAKMEAAESESGRKHSAE
jgi:lysophospholipase L1-like esterase